MVRSYIKQTKKLEHEIMKTGEGKGHSFGGKAEELEEGSEGRDDQIPCVQVWSFQRISLCKKRK